MTFIARPSSVFREYVKSTGSVDSASYQMGMMALALEIITQIKILEDLRAIATDLGRSEAVSALETLLIDCGLRDVAYEMYDRLYEWRKPKFRPNYPYPHPPLGERHEPAPEGISYVVVLGDPLPRSPAALRALEHASLEGAELPRGMRLALPPGRHGQDEDSEPSSELEESSSSGAQGTSGE